MMTTTTPDWLTTHGGELTRGIDDRTWLVLLAGGPQYKLTVTPAKGRFSCAVAQTVNGRRLDKGAEFPTALDALQGGLADLREHLGW